jgi:ribosomal protein S18 acetylase RimI-like enzyme
MDKPYSAVARSCPEGTIAMTPLKVRPLNTSEELQRYIDFAHDVYRDNPYWVPVDAHHLMSLLGGQADFGPESHIQAFCVEDGERMLATVAAVRDEAYNRHWNEQTGHLLFFEALPNQNEAVDLLFITACDWLRARGCDAARLSMLPGMQLPLTIDAYDTVPTCFHTYNPAYYHNYIKNGGFMTEHGLVEYQVQFTPQLAERYSEMIKRAEDAGVSLRSWDFDRLEEESDTFGSLCNETFQAHWGSMPLPTAVMRGFTVGFKDFLIPEFTAFAEIDGNPVGFVYSLPDINQPLHRMKGKALDENIADFLRLFQEIDHGVLLIIGVKKDYRGRGVNLGLAAKSYLAMIDRGYKSASYTVVLDDNWPSRRTAEKLGARVTKSFNVYRKELGAPK